MSNFSIVVPNRYPDVIQPLLESLKKHEPNHTVHIIADGHQESYGHHLIEYPHNDFQFAKAVNLGLDWVMNHGDADEDVALINDDITLLDDSPLTRLWNLMNDIKQVGLVSPMIRGTVGNPAQRYHEKPKYWQSFESIKLVWGATPVCFPCVLLRREMIHNIGYLDESIYGYGHEDNEYCIRARRAGWWTSIDPTVLVQHGDGKPGMIRGKSWSLSFARRYPHPF